MYILTYEFMEEKVIKKEEMLIEAVRADTSGYYTLIEIPKSKGKRKICALKQGSELYKIQKNIQKNFLSKIPLPVCVKGFCKETSYVHFLKTHKNKKFYMRIDIKDFFDSIKLEQIRDNLEEYVKNEEALDTLIDLCTYEDSLPQGAITSPSISNIVFRRIDQRITKYCQKVDVEYTRYADDLVFSSNIIDFKNKKWFLKKIRYILRENGFLINKDKIRKQEKRLSLNGFVINDQISLSRKKFSNINRIIYYFKNKEAKGRYKVDNALKEKNWLGEINDLRLVNSKNKILSFESDYHFINYLCGYRAFILEIANEIQEENNRKKKQLLHKVGQIEKIINWIMKQEE